MSVLTAAEVVAYLRVNGQSANVDDSVLQGLIDTAEALVAQRVGPLTSGSQTLVTTGSPFVLPAATVSAVASATNIDTGQAVTTGFIIGAGGVVTNLSCAFGTWTVVYTAGWAQMPCPVRTAVLELVRHLWKPQQGALSRPQSSPADGVGYLIPNRVRELLNPYAISGFA